MTRLTIPQAPVSTGVRAAAPRVDEQNAGAAAQAVAGLGNAAFGAGTQLENKRLTIERNRMQIDLQKDLDALSLEVQGLSDPTQIQATWQARTDQLRTLYRDGDPASGRAPLDPKLAVDFDVAFDTLVAGPGRAAARHATNSATVYAQRELTNASYQGVQGNQLLPEELEAFVQRREAAIDEQIANELITPAQGAEQKQAVRENAISAAAETMLAEDPEQVLVQMKAGAFDHLPPDAFTRLGKDARQAIIDRADAISDAEGREWEAGAIALARDNPQLLIDKHAAGDYAGRDPIKVQRLVTSAKGKLKSNATAAAREAEAAAKARARDIGQTLDRVIASADADVTPAQWAQIQSDPEFQAHPKFPVAMARMTLQSQHGALEQLPADQLQKLIDVERATIENGPGVPTQAQIDRITALEQIRDTTEDGWDGDQIAHARAIHIAVPDLPLDDPTAFARGIGARSQYIETITEMGYTSAPRYFSDEEQEQLRDLFAEGEDAARQAQMLDALTRGAPTIGEARRMMGELGFERDLQHLAGLQAAGGNPAIVRRALEGRQDLALNNMRPASQNARLVASSQAIGDLFADVPHGFEAEAATRRTADLLYARARRRGGEQLDATTDITDLDQDLYKQAVHEALGGTGNAGDRNQRGGITEIFDRPTILPPGMAVSDVGAALDAIDVTRFTIGAAVRQGMQKQQRALSSSVFSAASLTGGIPDNVSVLRDFEELSSGFTMQSVGNDRYVLVRRTQQLSLIHI